jgi:hypothetical protein
MRAVAIARKRNEARVLLATEAALESVHTRRLAVPVPDTESVAADYLATEFVGALRAFATV